MRNTPLRAFAKKSPVEFDFTKKADYSQTATKGLLGDKIAKAVTPKSIAETLPIGKIGKAVKTAWNFFKG